jgi:hypothetical protein
MNDTFTIEVQYGIKYETFKPAPIPEIIESLQSLERLLKRTPGFIEKAYKDIEILETTVRVSKIESGSLIEDFIVKYVFKGRNNADDAKKVFDNIMADNTAIRTIVAMGVGGLMMYGALQLLPKGEPTTHIEAYDNNIINIGGKVDLSAEDFRAVLESITDKKSLAKETVGAVKPAKTDGDSKITVKGLSELDIPQEVVREIPDQYDPPTPAERETHYKDVEIVVYASDRDKNENGWAGIIPGVVEKRTSFILDEAINPSKLHGRIRFRGDIIAHERFVPRKKEYEVRKVEILKTN